MNWIIISGIAILAVSAILGLTALYAGKSRSYVTKTAPAFPTTRWYNNWTLWFLLIVTIAVGWWALGHQTRPGTPPMYPPVTKKAPQKFSLALDPLQFDRTRSSGVEIKKIDGFTTVIVHPGKEFVIEFNMEVPPTGTGHISIDYNMRESIAQYASYRINDVRHEPFFMTAGSGHVSLGPELREFREGKNEIAFFSEGELRIDGDTPITITRQ